VNVAVQQQRMGCMLQHMHVASAKAGMDRQVNAPSPRGAGTQYKDYTSLMHVQSKLKAACKYAPPHGSAAAVLLLTWTGRSRQRALIHASELVRAC
jgi:hypothetical protein